MKAFRRILLGLLVLVLLALISGTLFLNNMRNSAVPDYSENVDLENLTQQVEVLRDSLGIPHVYAQNEADLYRVIGYLSAQDRLWQMDLMRRITTGRLSEIFGADMINADQLFRSFDFSGKSKKVLERTDPAILACLDAYADGVNQFIETHQKKLSFEFGLLGYKPEPWTRIHTTNLIGYMAWDLTSGWNSDMAIYKLSQLVDSARLAELMPWDRGFNTRYIFPDFLQENSDLAMESLIDDAVKVIDDLGVKILQASNNWAVSGARSETGMPLLANDMHLGFMSPGIWYQVHQVIEGKLNVTGVMLPGQPYVICGHNDSIAWGMTNVTIDNLDFYLETLNPDDTTQYKLNGRWVDMRIKEETIQVKGADPVTRINRFTHRGPIVSSFKGVKEKTISARWIGMDYSNEMRTVHLLNRAHNWNDFRDAAKTFIAVSQNIVYADLKGNIGLQTSGGVPIREGDHVMIYPGDTTLYDWGEGDIVPFEELPYSFNPERGYVSSANNKTVDDTYPYYIGTWFSLPNRIDRIRELLEATEKHSVESFKAIHSDQTSAFARKVTPAIVEALDGKLQGMEGKALQLLSDWDYNMDKELAAPLIYEQFFIELIHSIYEDELGAHLDLIKANNIIAKYHIYDLVDRKESIWCDDVRTDNMETFSDNILDAFLNTIDSLKVLAGPDLASWKWGDYHTLTIEHPMGGVSIVNKLFSPNLGPFAVGGGSHTVAPYSYPLDAGFKVNHGASQRHIYVLGDWDASWSVIPTGTSGVPASPYYGNQTNLYMNFKYHKDMFSREFVEAQKRYKAVYQ